MRQRPHHDFVDRGGDAPTIRPTQRRAGHVAMNPLKEAIRTLAAKVGYDVRSTGSLGISPFADMRKFVPVATNSLILDIGANVGQSVGRFRKAFPAGIIHSFEPGPETFKA